MRKKVTGLIMFNFQTVSSPSPQFILLVFLTSAGDRRHMHVVSGFQCCYKVVSVLGLDSNLKPLDMHCDMA